MFTMLGEIPKEGERMSGNVDDPDEEENKLVEQTMSTFNCNKELAEKIIDYAVQISLERFDKWMANYNKRHRCRKHVSK